MITQKSYSKGHFLLEVSHTLHPFFILVFLHPYQELRCVVAKLNNSVHLVNVQLLFV